MFRHFLFALVATPLVFAACSNPEEPNPELTVDFKISAGHIHIWETQVTYTVLITTANGVLSDFQTLQLEYGSGGNWKVLGPLTLQTGGSYAATYYFPEAGTFVLRLTGQRPKQSGLIEIYQTTTPIVPVRQHFNAGTWRVEFEPNPGVNKPGDTPAVKFYVMQATADAQGVRAPITSLTGVTISCVDPNGTSATHNATESAGGVYSANHTFQGTGMAQAKMSFTGSDGQPTTVTGTFGIGIK